MILVDTAVAALALGVSERTIRRMVEAGLLTNHGTARKIRVALADLASVR